jgi:hypothetical protein
MLAVHCALRHFMPCWECPIFETYVQLALCDDPSRGMRSYAANLLGRENAGDVCKVHDAFTQLQWRPGGDSV